eukprot:TRINITY_DN9467_c0_g2_i1.p1 TRINITY_DN9467_c0_g2~~TRINITY_DN9467_c0_g2_i1.p1  ORF type:complete len:480 (+),score=86.07 TRINITY_DN9467_c0_g2_i1:117-1442(+)
MSSISEAEDERVISLSSLAREVAAKEAGNAGSSLSQRAMLVVLLLLFHEPEAHPVIGRAFASLKDLRYGGSKETRPVHTSSPAPLNFAKLRKRLTQRLQEDFYSSILLYSLVVKNEVFRCCCQIPSGAEEVVPAALEVLNAAPAATEGIFMATAPPAATALLLTLLTLSGDSGFCENISQARMADSGRLLNNQRPIKNVAISSMLITVILRLAHWNFGACRDRFFNDTVAGILGNLSCHGVEHVHWYVANKMLEVASLLARNVVKLPPASSADAAEDCPADLGKAAELHRSRMVRALLQSLLRLISSCLKSIRVRSNCALVYALQRSYPAQFAALENDPDFGKPLVHVRSTVEWFEEQCPPTDDGLDVDAQADRLRQASAKMPGEMDTLAIAACTPNVYKYRETTGVSDYFLPVVWKEASRLIPEHVCWSRAAAPGTKNKN